MPNHHAPIIAAEIADAAAALVDVTHGTWLRHPKLGDGGARNKAQEHQKVLDFVTGAFFLCCRRHERWCHRPASATLGAVHAVHAHWSVTETPATVVMPTGTRKTETMLSILVSGCCSRVLVIVPTDALRTQIAEKFLTLGVLKIQGATILNDGSRHLFGNKIFAFCPC